MTESDQNNDQLVAQNLTARRMPQSTSEVRKLLDKGIPVWRAEFHSAVNNSDDVPETNFSSKSHTASRNVRMWWVSGDGLLCLHKGEYFMVPGATVKFCKFEKSQ